MLAMLSRSSSSLCLPAWPLPTRLFMPPCAALQAESLQAQVEGLAAEKAAQYEGRVQAETRLASLEAELSSACSELESAKHTGTPKGEGGACSELGQHCRQAADLLIPHIPPSHLLLAGPDLTLLLSPMLCHSLCAGEGAKEVSRLAFQRIRELQSAVEDARLDVGAREERIAQLERQVAALSKAAAAAQVGGGGLPCWWLVADSTA